MVWKETMITYITKIIGYVQLLFVIIFLNIMFLTPFTKRWIFRKMEFDPKELDDMDNDSLPWFFWHAFTWKQWKKYMVKKYPKFSKIIFPSEFFITYL